MTSRSIRGSSWARACRKRANLTAPFAGSISRIPVRTCALQAADGGKAAHSDPGVLQQVDQAVNVYDGRGDAYLLCKLALPFFPEHRRAENEQTPQFKAAFELGPDQTSFDGLAKPDFVGDEQGVARRHEEPKHRLELIGVEVGVRCLHAVNDVREATGEPYMNQGATEINCAAELTSPQQIDRTLLLDGYGSIRSSGIQTGGVRESDLVAQPLASPSGLGPSGKHADMRGVSLSGSACWAQVGFRTFAQWCRRRSLPEEQPSGR